jgi:cell wall-associated NlpC family hydrolase
MDFMKNTRSIIWCKQAIQILALSLSALFLFACSTKHGIPSLVTIRAERAAAKRMFAANKIKNSPLNPKSAAQPRPEALDDTDTDTSIDNDTESYQDDVAVNTQNSDDISEDDVRELILREFDDWKGTPYRLGGNTKDGIDCSGFAHLIYTSVFNMDVPRCSGEFMNTGEKVSKDEMKPGDILIFSQPRAVRHKIKPKKRHARIRYKTTYTYARHVGIYIGDNMFIHSSSSNGVHMSDITSAYWQKYFKMARRIIKE